MAGNSWLMSISPLTSGTISGMSSWYLKHEELSTTTHPCETAFGANCDETEAPAENKAKSVPLKSYSAKS